MADGNLGQDDIDKMLSELGAGGAQPATPEPPKPLSTPAPVAAAASAGGNEALDQDAIDALIAQASEAISAPPKPAIVSAGPGGHLDQNEIDKLLADLDPHSRKSNATNSSSAATHLDQNDIDRLLNELEVQTGGSASEVLPAAAKAPASKSSPIAVVAKPPPAQPLATTAVAAMPAAAPAVTASAVKRQGAAEGPLSQDDIDKLLSELGAPSSSLGAEKKQAPVVEAPVRSGRTVPPAPQPVEQAPAKPAADATQALSAEEIDAIVAKQGSTAPPGSESEAVIAQSDIDALVKQLAQATGSPEADEVAEAIAGKAADIDRIQAEAASPLGPELTRDAVDVNTVLGHTASTTSLHAQPMPMFNVATVGVGEWRWGQWILMAAVLALCVCSGALILLTFRVSDLSVELRAAREVEHPAVDGYADKLRLALAKLGESDEAERARGVRWMEDIKRQFPDRASEVGIALARHLRSREAWRRAADEYGAALETLSGSDDPRVLLEYADCLVRLGDDAGAIRQVYTLLAAEARWVAERDPEGRPVSGLDRNRQAIADAYLMLGRLLARTGAPVPMAKQSASAAPAAEPAGGHH